MQESWKTREYQCTLESELTANSIKHEVEYFKARFDKALNKEEQVPASDLYSFTSDLKKEDRLISFVIAVTVLDFWPARGHSGDFAGGSQGRFLIREALEGKRDEDWYLKGFCFCFIYQEGGNLLQNKCCDQNQLQ